MKKTTIKQKVVLVLLGVFLGVVLLEAGMQGGALFLRTRQSYRNRMAAREQGSVRILCLGESTTAMGGSHSYPSQLEIALNKNNKGIKFTVINEGIIGTDSATILAHLSQNLKRYHPDIVIAMIGINDNKKTEIFSSQVTLDSERGKPFWDRLKIRHLARWLWQLYRQPAGKFTELKSDETINILAGSAGEIPGFGENDQKDEQEDVSEAVINKGIEYIIQGRFKEANDLMETLQGIMPDYNEAYVKMGEWSFAYAREHEKAKNFFERALKINPDDYDAKLGLSVYDIFRGEYGKAEKDLRPLGEHSPNLERLSRILAVVNELQGKREEADRFFKEADKFGRKNTPVATRQNYRNLIRKVLNGKRQLICMQYPMRDVGMLKKLLGDDPGVIYVDIGPLFREALRREGYPALFSDMYGGDFGHATEKGNRLLAENLAGIIISLF